MFSFGPTEWVPLADFKKAADVNLWGMMDVTKTFLPLVKKAKGRVVLVSSIAGKYEPRENETKDRLYMSLIRKMNSLTLHPFQPRSQDLSSSCSRRQE